MYHSITIGSRNTWRHWHLIPSSRPLVNPPNVKAAFIEIPGADGALDLSDTLVGRATYGNRSGSWEFYVDNGYSDWATLYSEIMAYLHGQLLKAVLEDDPLFYYEGRFSVNQWNSDPYYSRIVIDYNVGPYKMYSITDGDRWEWDPFNFETDSIHSYRNMVVKKNEELVVTIQGDVMDIVPLITAQANGVIMYFNNSKYVLKRGTHLYEDVVLTSGANVLTFEYEGSGSSTKVTLKMTGGRL